MQLELFTCFFRVSMSVCSGICSSMTWASHLVLQPNIWQVTNSVGSYFCDEVARYNVEYLDKSNDVRVLLNITPSHRRKSWQLGACAWVWTVSPNLFLGRMFQSPKNFLLFHSHSLWNLIQFILCLLQSLYFYLYCPGSLWVSKWASSWFIKISSCRNFMFHLCFYSFCMFCLCLLCLLFKFYIYCWLKIIVSFCHTRDTIGLTL